MAEARPPAGTLVRFGIFEVDLRAGELRRNGLKVKLQEQPFQLLVMLLEHPGEVVTREEIQQKLWPSDTFVDFEHSINAAVKRLREALDDSADNPRFVETLHRRGYRFIAPVLGTDGFQTVAGATRGVAQGEAAPRPYKVLALAVGIVVVALAALLTLNVGGLRDRFLRAVGASASRRTAPLPKIESIAVLPLENLSHDPEQEYFADGMTDALITNLGKIRALRVISRTTAMHFKGTKKTLPEIARELNVDAVVEGSVLRSGNRVRITANLLHAPTDRHLWANSYEGEMQDVLVLQGEVARAIAEEVRIKLTPEEQVRLAGTHLVNPEAYQAFLRGRHHLNLLEAEELKKGVELLQRAIDIEPTYAPSYSSMAEGYWRLGFDGAVPPPEAFLKSRAVATKALELDGTLGEAHAVLGLVELFFEWDFASADQEYRRAVELSPNSADVQLSYGNYLTLVGRFDEGIAAGKRAAALDPLNPVAVQLPGWACFHARRYDEGIEYLRKQLEIDPNLFLGHYQLAHNYAGKGMYAEALAEAEKAKCGIDCGWVYAVSGRRAEAWKSVQKLEEESRRKYVTPMAIAWVYAGLGEKNHAIRWLQKGYEMRDSHMVFLEVAPELDLLRPDPRFQDLLRRMNFPP